MKYKPGPIRRVFLRVMAPLYKRMTRRPYRLARRVTPSGWLVFGLACLTGFMGVDIGRTALYQMFVFFSVLSIVGLFSTIFFHPRIRVRRKLPRYATAGEAVSYPAEVTNRGRFTLRHLSLVELPPAAPPTTDAFVHEVEPGEHTRNLFDRVFAFYRWTWLVEKYRLVRSQPSPPVDVPPRAAEPTRVMMQVTPNRRGLIELGRIGVMRPDIFGLIKALRFRRGPADELLVLPKRYPLPALSLPGRSQYQPAGLALASATGRSDEFMSLRDYRPGDPIRHMHWRTWARTRRPVVKEYEDEFVPRYTLVLDTFADADPDDCFEEAVAVAASFACELDTQESLLDLLFIGAEAYCFSSDRGARQTEMMLEVLASVQLSGSKGIDALERHVLSRVRDMSACVCIFLDWDEPRKALVRSLQANNVPVMPLVVSTSLSDGGGGAGGIKILHPERVAEGLAKL